MDLRRSSQLAVPLVRGAALGALLCLGGPGGGVALQACASSGGDSTTGKRVVLHTRAMVSEEAQSTFSNSFGWRISLTEAATSAGPFYYFDGAPPLAVRHERSSWQYAARWLGLGMAHAHPGHYQAGNAMGQMLEASSLDLLAGEAELPDGEGVTGTYRSARFTLGDPTGPAAKILDGHAALAEGVAEKDGEEPRYFRATADLAEIAEHAADGKVEGCELEEVDVDGDGTITITIDPVVWFDLVDFSEADLGNPDEPAELPVDSQPRIAFALGVTQLSAYKFRYSP